MMNVEVGDEVFVFEGIRSRSGAGGFRGRVTEVRRTLFAVDCHEAKWLSGDYRLDNGRRNQKDSRTYVKTPEQVERSKRVLAAELALREAGIEIASGHRSKYPLERLEALVVFVRSFH